MSIFKVLEDKTKKEIENYSEYLSDKSGDILKGSEFMFYALSKFFINKSSEEIETGIVDSAYKGEKYDFGIDAIYITGSKDFIENKEQLESYNVDTKFVIHIFQFKKGKGIAQADLLKLKTGIEKVLVSEDISDDDNLYFYNRMIVLNEIKTALYENFNPDNIKVVCHIAFGGIEKNITSETILTDALDSIQVLLQDNGFTNNEIHILDAQKLIQSSSNEEEIIDIISYEKTFKYIKGTDKSDKLNGYIAIVKGSEIAELVRKYQTSLFEANIRDYYKRSTLNSKITETSASEEEAKFFWSFNNGLTMTCNKVDELPNDKYKLTNLQIVNGCQTSNAIYYAVKNKERVKELQEKQNKDTLTKKESDELLKNQKLQFNEETNLLVKIVETENEDLIYRITETTNSQTPIKAFSLKANDDIQFLIEQFLVDNGVWYERRLNFYKNKGKRNIVGIQKLFQLYTSQILLNPSQVKTRPKSMFVNSYEDVFPSPSVKSINYLLYLIPILVDQALNKKISEVRRNDTISDKYQDTILSYGKLHLGCFILSSILKNEYSEKGIIKNAETIKDELNNNIEHHFSDALLSFEKLLKSFVGNRKEAIITGVRKTELDNKISKYIKTRK